jgi:Acyclic terpene utilisation family protein AtuA
VVDERTVKLQLGYEIHDPANYLTPDVTLDVSQTAVRDLGDDRVEVSGMVGKPAPETLKVLVGLDLGWRAGSELSFGGPGCLERAEYAKELLAARCAEFSAGIVDQRADLIGVDSLFGDRVAAGYPAEVRLRFAARCRDEDVAKAYMFEARHLSFSLAGSTASVPTMERFIGVTRAYVPRSAVALETTLVTV